MVVSVFFLNEAPAGTLKHVCQPFHANIPGSDLPNSYVTFKVDHNAKTPYHTKTM